MYNVIDILLSDQPITDLIIYAKLATLLFSNSDNNSKITLLEK